MSPHPGRSVALLLASFLASCATSEFDSVMNVQSICNVTFKAEQIVQVSGEFDGDRYHGNGLFHHDCPGVYWTVDWSDEFYAKYVKRLELENAIFQGTAFSKYRVEVEGRLFVSSEGGPAIKLMKLRKAERMPR